MKETIRHILKEEKIKQKVQQLIEDVGILNAIQTVGGMEVFISIMGNDFFTTQRKIEVIKEIASKFDDFGRGVLFLDEIGIEMIIGGEQFDDGSQYKSYITYVADTGRVRIQTWEFDEDGWMMYDDPIDDNHCELDDLDSREIRELFDSLVNKFLS
jgi:hypothetical protein